MEPSDDQRTVIDAEVIDSKIESDPTASPSPAALPSSAAPRNDPDAPWRRETSGEMPNGDVAAQGTPSATAENPAPVTAPAVYAHPYPVYPHTAYPHAAYPHAAYPQAEYTTPPPIQKKTNGLAVAAMVVAIKGFALCGLGFVGAIMGHVARKQIRERGEDGDGFAKAGIIIGWGGTAFYVLLVAGYIALVAFSAAAAS